MSQAYWLSFHNTVMWLKQLFSEIGEINWLIFSPCDMALNLCESFSQNREHVSRLRLCEIQLTAGGGSCDTRIAHEEAIWGLLPKSNNMIFKVWNYFLRQGAPGPLVVRYAEVKDKPRPQFPMGQMPPQTGLWNGSLNQPNGEKISYLLGFENSPTFLLFFFCLPAMQQFNPQMFPHNFQMPPMQNQMSLSWMGIPKPDSFLKQSEGIHSFLLRHMTMCWLIFCACRSSRK